MPFNAAKSSALTRGLIHIGAAISANPGRNYGGTVLTGGNINNGLVAGTTFGKLGNMTNSLTLANNSFRVGDISGRLMVPVSPADSGNVGITIPIAGGTFGKNTKGAYVGMVVGTKIAGLANTTLRSPSADYNRKNGFTLTPNYRYQTLGITSWSYVTGKATYDANRQGSGVNLLPDSGALVTDAVPGHLFYMYGAYTPRVDAYKARTGT